MGWPKLSTNRYAIGNSGLAGGGRLIRNENSEWVIGYARSLGITS